VKQIPLSNEELLHIIAELLNKREDFQTMTTFEGPRRFSGFLWLFIS
jgi:hypothetical protein